MNKLIETKRMLDSYGISGKAKDPAGSPRRLKNLAPWKAEHPVVDINHTLLRKFGNTLFRQ
ncbi:hypothetical protein COI44_13050 [Bacillus sp. AFS088145]|nr:hypothetical protein COI44_13050 [Bacillus sp. AFS088145]